LTGKRSTRRLALGLAAVAALDRGEFKMGKLEDRTAIVTGGATGIGRQYAQALAREGATVAIVDLADCEAAATQINSGLGRKACLGISADVGDEVAVKGAMSRILENTGRIDVLVNNAAIYSALAPVAFADIDVAQWDQVMAVNLRGPFLMVKHAAPTMIARKYGKIINVSSGTAYKGMPLMLHYVTSKGGILAFTRALSRELGAHNICVNTLAPGLIKTEGTHANSARTAAARDQVIRSRALQRDGYPADLLGALIFLSSGDSDFITGQTIVVDGGSVNT
jgi:NAD(P)-dependent dehydrogenase (short-subunit alcohol dehydrogenase family)